MDILLHQAGITPRKKKGRDHAMLQTAECGCILLVVEQAGVCQWAQRGGPPTLRVGWNLPMIWIICFETREFRTVQIVHLKFVRFLLSTA